MALLENANRKEKYSTLILECLKDLKAQKIFLNI